MTPLSQTILEHHRIRKTGKQKRAFLSLLQQRLPGKLQQENGNLILGDITQAKVLLAAHYDTGSKSLFDRMTIPEKPFLTVLFRFIWFFPLLLLLFGIAYLLKLTGAQLLLLLLGAAAVFFLIAVGFRQSIAPDNTAGVITLCELAQVLNDGQRQKTAFLFFDRRLPDWVTLTPDSLLILFDSPSSGNQLLVCADKPARNLYGKALKRAFLPTKQKSILFKNAEKVFCPSARKSAVTVSVCKAKKRSDSCVFDKATVTLLCESILRFIKEL